MPARLAEDDARLAEGRAKPFAATSRDRTRLTGTVHGPSGTVADWLALAAADKRLLEAVVAAHRSLCLGRRLAERNRSSRQSTF